MNILKISLFSLFFLLLNFLNYFYFFEKMMIFLIVFFIIIFFGNVSLCLTIFNDKKYNSILKNRLIFIIIVFPLLGATFYLIWEIVNQKKNKCIKKKFPLTNTKNFEWKNISWQKNNLIFTSTPNLIKTINELFRNAKKMILLQIFSYQDYAFLNNNGLIETLIDIAKTKKIKIFINHNLHIKKKDTKKYRNFSIVLNKVPIVLNVFNPYSDLIIIDSRQALYGNFNNSFNYNFIISNKIVENLKSCFFGWIDKKQLQENNILFAATSNNSNEVESCFQYFGLSIDLNVILLDLIYAAKKSIKIFSNCFIPNSSIKLALQFAIKKNIDVKIITFNSSSNFCYLVNFSLNNSLLEQKNLWWETTKKINDSFIIIDDDIVLLTSNFNFSSLLSHFYPMFWFNFQNKQNQFLKIFNEEINNCIPIKKHKNNLIKKMKKIFYLIVYPFVL